MATTESRMKQLTGAYADLNKSNMLVGEMAVPSDHVPVVRNGVNSWEDLLTSQSAGDIIALSETMTEQIESFEQLVIDKVGINDSTATLTQAYSGSKTQGLIDGVNTNLSTKASQSEVDLKASQSDLDSTNAELIAKASQAALNVEKARIDNFTTLAAGSTTGDAELIDSRTDANGKVWTNSGSALRAVGAGTAVKGIKTKNINIYNYARDYVDGKWYDGNGALNTSAETGLANIPVNQNKVYSMCRPANALYDSYLGIAFLDSNKNLISFAKTDSGTILDIGGYYNSNPFVRFTTPSNCCYIGINVKWSTWDSTSSLIIIEGGTLEGTFNTNASMYNIYGNNISDDYLRNSIVTKRGNLYKKDYVYYKHWIGSAGDYNSNDMNYAVVKIPVKELTTYSMQKVGYDDYTATYGTILYYNASGTKLSYNIGYDLGKTYNGAKYINFDTPATCAYVMTNILFTSSKNAINSFILVEGDTLDDNAVTPYITEILGKKVANEEIVKDNLYNKVINSVEGYWFDNTYAFVNSGVGNAAYAKFEVSPGEVYSVCRPQKPIYTDNYLSVAFYDVNMTFISASNAKTFPEVDMIYNTVKYYKGYLYITAKAPANAKYMCIVTKVAALDSRYDLIVVEGTIIENDSDENKIKSINGNLLRDTETRNIAESARYPYKDKTWGVLGDSLTEKNYRAKVSYYDYVAQDLGMQILNYGSSGKGYKQAEAEGHAFYQNVLRIDPNIDVLTIFGSGNDNGYFATAMGTAADTGTTTLGGCINTTIDNFYSVAPYKKIALVTPTPWYNFPPTTPGNGMELYTNLIIEIAKRRGIPYLDLYHCSGLIPWDSNFRTQYYNEDGTQDTGIHPNSLGHKFMYPMWREFLKSLL